jgi:REP element-mobilizing transposase RayT
MITQIELNLNWDSAHHKLHWFRHSEGTELSKVCFFLKIHKKNKKNHQKSNAPGNFSPLLIYMRRVRKLLPEARYHIIARANRGEMIFLPNEFKDMFLEVVKRAQKKYRFVISNFCIMGNHIHYLLKPLKGENLSRIMQWILSVFAMKYNRHFNYKGHVFYDRFKSVILYNFREYVRAFIYIMENPVKAGIVKNPEEYLFSGIYFLKMGWYDFINPPDIVTGMIGVGIYPKAIYAT